MNNRECTEKFCVIGAGAAGLVASKCLKNWEIPFDVIESACDVGGLWRYDKTGSPMYKNTHLISPKQIQAFSDFPMPGHYPDFPNHTLVLEYLCSYANNFGLYEHIEFNLSVEKIEKAGKFWDVRLSNGQSRRYRGVILASGYHNHPKYPKYHGNFNGKILHSKDYKIPQQLSNYRVLIVGAGQSAMDIVVESAINAKQTFHSTRRGFLCIPKYLFGKPTELLLQKELPLLNNLPLQKFFKLFLILVSALLNLQGVSPKKCKIPDFDFSKGFIIPNIDHQIYRYYLHGDIIHKPNVKELKGDKVLFEDGSEEYVDIIIYATGYDVSFPFIENSLLNWKDNVSVPHLYLHIFHPEYDNIFVIGMVHPLGAHWTVFEYQSQLVAGYIKAKENNSHKFNEFNRIKKYYLPDMRGGLEINTPEKHPLLVDKMHYLKFLKQLINNLLDEKNAWEN